jgi:tetratricopeptide (TPR) repeat protein
VLVAATCDVTTLVGELRRGPRGRRLVVFVGEVGEAHDHALELGPLDASELERIIAEQFGFSDAASHRLARQAEGNPGAAVRWARLAIRENLVRRTPAGLELAGSKMRALVQESRHWDVRLEHAIDDDVSAEQALRLAASVGEYVLQSEFEAICAAIDARANELLARFFDAGVLVVHDDEIRFAHPDARQAMLGRDRLSTHDFSILADVFANLASSDRRIRIGALAALKAGEASPQMCLERARELRRRGAVADSLRLLSGIREHNQSKDWDMALAQEQLECHIAQHAYDAARAVLASTMQRTPTLDALELFLAHRSGDDVQDALLRVDTSDLSETATRMVAYAWTDIGAFDRARAALETLDPELDPAGKYYALARLALLQDEWTDAKRFGQQAARAFADSSQLEGRLVALDIVASARLQLGELDAAIGDYRGLEEQAEQLGAPTWPYKCNLAVALLRLEPPPLEIEAHLESVIADVIEAGRRDVEHYARAAQALYALKRGKVALARKRLESLRDMGAGQWMVDDVLVLLREMDASVCDTSLAAIVDEVLAAAEEALA